MIQRTGWYCWKQRTCKGGSFKHCFVRRCSSPEKTDPIENPVVFPIYIAAQTSKTASSSQYKKDMAKVKHPRPLLATVCCVTINQQQCWVRPIEARLLFSSTIKWARPFTASLTLLLIGPGTWPWQWPCLEVTDFDFWRDAWKVVNRNTGC